MKNTKIICPKCLGEMISSKTGSSIYYKCHCGFQATGSFYGQYKASPEEMNTLLRGGTVGPFLFETHRTHHQFWATLRMNIDDSGGKIRFADYLKADP